MEKLQQTLKDRDFLVEMKERLEKGDTEYVGIMIQDWIDELEKVLEKFE